jgi:glutamate formiminotransferase/formiminotetrahydrofolate cyclodeaminase
MKVAAAAIELLEEMAEKGNPNSASDVAVGALCLRTAVSGAYLNVRINAAEIKDTSLVEEVLTQADQLEKETIIKCEKIQEKVLLKICSK